MMMHRCRACFQIETISSARYFPPKRDSFYSFCDVFERFERERERVYEQTKRTLTCVITSFVCLFDKQLLQKKALERVLGEIDSTFGKGSIMKLGSAGQAKVATFPSGAMTLDMAL